MESCTHLWPEAYKLRTEESECDVWRLSLDLSAARLHSLRGLLSEDECRRAECFGRSVDKDRFVARRGLLRERLSIQVGERPELLRFVLGRQGKPGLADGALPLQFNLSHCGPLALLAVAHREVGIDLQALDARSDWERLARRFFSPCEQAVLASLPCSLRRRTFFQMWCQREAVAKAQGNGLSGLLTAAQEPSPWSLVTIDLGGDDQNDDDQNYAACLAIRRLQPGGMKDLVVL